MSARKGGKRKDGRREDRAPEDGTPEETAKARILAIVREQPDDSSYDDVLRELAFDRLVRRGLGSLDRRRFTTDEMRQRVKSWHD